MGPDGAFVTVITDGELTLVMMALGGRTKGMLFGKGLAVWKGSGSTGVGVGLLISFLFARRLGFDPMGAGAKEDGDAPPVGGN